MAGKPGQKSDKSITVPPRYKGGFLKDLDGRAPVVRGLRYRRACLQSDLGGTANLSTMEHTIIDRIVHLIYLAEETELALASGNKIHVADYLSTINCLSGLLSKVGLKRRVKQISLKDYLNNKPESISAPKQPAPSEPKDGDQ